MDIMTYILIAIIILVVIFAKMALVIIPQSETKDRRASRTLLCHAPAGYQHHHPLYRPRQVNRCAQSWTLHVFYYHRPPRTGL